MLPSFRTLNWVDGFAALASGSVALLLHDLYIDWFNLPSAVIDFQIGMSFAYAAFSLWLARKEVKPRPFPQILVAANAFYSLVCFGLFATYLGQATVFGSVFLALEYAFVGILATLEWLALRRERVR